MFVFLLSGDAAKLDSASQETSTSNEEPGSGEADLPAADWQKVQRRAPRSRKSSECTTGPAEGEPEASTVIAAVVTSAPPEPKPAGASLDDMEELDFAFSHESPSQKAAAAAAAAALSYNPKVSSRTRNVSVVLFSPSVIYVDVYLCVSVYFFN